MKLWFGNLAALEQPILWFFAIIPHQNRAEKSHVGVSQATDQDRDTVTSDREEPLQRGWPKWTTFDDALGR